jgi:hypothetical protein
MVGDVGRNGSLPMFPAGAIIFDALPLGALVLDALAPAIANGLISMRDGGREAVLVIRDGIVCETVWVEDGVRSDGKAALALIREAAHTTMVSAHRLSGEAMGLLAPLIKGDPCYADLRVEWVVWPKLLTDLRDRGGTFVVELFTPAGCGVTVIQNGQHIATFTGSGGTLGDLSLLDDLAAGGVGSIRVLMDRGAELPLPTALPPRVASSMDAPVQEFATESTIRPIIVPDDDPNATLSAFFGESRSAPSPYPQGGIRSPAGLNPHARPATIAVASLLPELKLLVRGRLQRSSGSVEQIVETAANDHQSIEWLADRVRVMTVRGFVHSTFDQLADDMLALAVR